MRQIKANSSPSYRRMESSRLALDNGFRETTEVIRHGLTLGRAAEDTVRLWKDHLDILATTGKYRYVIHVWQMKNCFHIEAGVRTAVAGKPCSRSIMIGDSSVAEKAFMCILEKEEYFREPLRNILEVTERMLHDSHGYNGLVIDYDLSLYTRKFNDGIPVLLREDGMRCDKEGKVIMEHPENTFGGWSSDVIAWML